MVAVIYDYEGIGENYFGCVGVFNNEDKAIAAIKATGKEWLINYCNIVEIQPNVLYNDYDMATPGCPW